MREEIFRLETLSALSNNISALRKNLFKLVWWGDGMPRTPKDTTDTSDTFIGKKLLDKDTWVSQESPLWGPQRSPYVRICYVSLNKLLTQGPDRGVFLIGLGCTQQTRSYQLAQRLNITNSLTVLKACTLMYAD